MKLKTSEEIFVPPDDPFKNDLFGRRPQVEYLTNIVENVAHPLVLSVHGSWGTGKTTFLKMWNGHLISRNVQTIYYNAWLNDFSQDPFLDIVSEISNSLGKDKPLLVEKAKSLGKYILKKSIPLSAKLLTAGLLDLKEITEEVMSDAVEKAVEDGIKNHENSKSSVDDFRKTLSSCVEKRRESGDNKNIVFFIDELDRCRPTYAIEVLERIKHFFNVKGMVFVICNDRDQLYHSVKNLYGAGTDADSYLRKFFDLEFSLPNPNKEAFIRAKFAEIEFEAIPKFQRYGSRRIVDYAIWIDRLMKTTPREISHIVRLFYLTSFSIEMERHGFSIDLILFLHFLKIKQPNSFEMYVSGKLKHEELLKLLDTQSVDRESKASIGNMIIKMEFSITVYSERENIKRKYANNEFISRDFDFLADLMMNSECTRSVFT